MPSSLSRISAAQLAAGLVGQAVAVVRRTPYELPWQQGRTEDVVRDSFTDGTAFSAPVPMFVLQGWATRRLARRPQDVLARRVLRGLGAVMVAGYLLERRDRLRLTPGGLDPLETPLVVVSVALAAGMALGRRQAR